MTSIALTGTNHTEDQPVHLRVVETKTYMEALDGEEGIPVSIGAGIPAVATMGETNGKRVTEEERKTRMEHVRANVEEYAGLLGRACPAGVYEYVPVRVWSAASLVRFSSSIVREYRKRGNETRDKLTGVLLAMQMRG